MNKDLKLNVIGIFLIILGIIRLIQLLFYGVPMHVFWLCNHVLILIGIGILIRNSYLLIGEVCFLFVGQVVWVLGFLGYYLFGFALEGTSMYLIYNPDFVGLISILVHFLTLPLGIWAIFILRKKNSWAWLTGIIHSVILLPIVILFSEYNLNCLNDPCISIFPNNLLYSILFVPFYFLLTVLPLNLLINYLLKKFEK